MDKEEVWKKVDKETGNPVHPIDIEAEELNLSQAWRNILGVDGNRNRDQEECFNHLQSTLESVSDGKACLDDRLIINEGARIFVKIILTFLKEAPKKTKIKVNKA